MAARKKTEEKEIKNLHAEPVTVQIAAEQTVKKAKKAVEKTVNTAKQAVEKTAKTAKKTAEKTIKTAKKAAKKTEPKCNMFVELWGRQIEMNQIKDTAIRAYKKAHRGVQIKNVELYIKPEDGAAYYVVNGDAAPEYKIEL